MGAQLMEDDWGDLELGPTARHPQSLAPWTPIGPSHPVFEHRFHGRLVESRVRVSTGAEQVWLRHADEREGVACRDSVAAVVRRDDGKILVAWQWNIGAARVVAEFPGGAPRPEESFAEAVQREVCEEVGLWPHDVRAIGRHYYDNRRSSAMYRWFLATDLEPRTMPGDEAEIATAWVPERAIDRWIAEGMVRNQTMLAAWALYRASTGV